ncbi:MAG: hypothetical protein PHU71_05945 [Candidatus Gracilibacteria bacterium]|nr:hypothetical protein [Candidatus Gracilibacteria bacterium]
MLDLTLAINFKIMKNQGREITQAEAEIAIALADRQQEVVAFALKNQEKLPSSPVTAEVIAEREEVVHKFRDSLRKTLAELATKSGTSLKRLGMKAIQICQVEIKDKRNILLENELAHAFYEEVVRFYSTFLGELSKDLLKANRENICFILKLVREKPQQGLEKSGQFFQGVGSRIASIEYQEKIEQLVQRIEEIYQNVLKNYKKRIHHRKPGHHRGRTQSSRNRFQKS